MTKILRPDFSVIGSGPGAIAAARVAAQRGAKVVLVDKRPLNSADYLRLAWQTPLLAAAASSTMQRRAAKFGAQEVEIRIDLSRLRRDFEPTIARFARADSMTQLIGLGVTIIQSAGAFTSPTRFEAGETLIAAHRFLLAVASFATAPAIKGLELVRSLTPDRITELTSIPRRLAVIGATPDNLALAQALLRLGSKVVLLGSKGLLDDIDEELAVPLIDSLLYEGLEIVADADVGSIELAGPGLQSAGVKLVLANGTSIEASHLLYAPEKMALVEGLGLKAAQVAYDKTGIKLDAKRRSSNRRIYALNDDTHSLESIGAARSAGEWLAEQLFGDKPVRPCAARVIATDPEIAVIGLSEREAQARHQKIQVLRAGFCDNLRAQTAAYPFKYPVPGHVKILADAQGRLLGAGIVGPQARELISLFGLALANRLTVADLAVSAAAGPALADICRTAALALAPQTGKGSLREALSARRWLR